MPITIDDLELRECTIDGEEVKSITIDGTEVWRAIKEVPPNTIVIWSGTEAQIPDGWLLCDGTNGTPNLVGRFILGSTTPGGTGGITTHVHTLSSGGSHTHPLSSGSHTHEAHGSGRFEDEAKNSIFALDGVHGHTMGTAPTHDHNGTSTGSIEPAHYVLAFIIRGGI